MRGARGAQGPKADAAELLRKRFPVPRLVDCDQNGSQARGAPAYLASALAVKQPQWQTTATADAQAKFYCACCIMVACRVHIPIEPRVYFGACGTR